MPARRGSGGSGWRKGQAARPPGAGWGGGRGPPGGGQGKWLPPQAASRVRLAAGPGRGAGAGSASALAPLSPQLGLERPRRRPRPTGPARPGPRGALTWRRRRLQAPGSAARVPSAGCGSHNMATAVAGGAAAPGAERGREPAWRRDLAGAAGGGWEGGRRKAARTWAPAQGGAAEGLPRPGPGFSPLAYRLPPPAPGGLRGTDPAVATATGWAGRGRCRAELDPRPRRPRPCPRPRLTRLPRRAPGAIPARRPLPATWASRSLTGLQGRGLRSGPRSPTRGPRSAYAAVSPQRTASASGAGTASSSLRSGT